jgi:hypothetical protein
LLAGLRATNEQQAQDNPDDKNREFGSGGSGEPEAKVINFCNSRTFYRISYFLVLF